MQTHDSDTDTYHNIFAWGSMEGVEGVVVASSAQHLPADDENVIRLELKDGARYDVRPGEAAYQSIFFEKYISENIIRKIFFEKKYIFRNIFFETYFSNNIFRKIFCEKYFSNNIYRKIFFEKYFFRKTKSNVRVRPGP